LIKLTEEGEGWFTKPTKNELQIGQLWKALPQETQ
jgi:hypothetical protein